MNGVIIVNKPKSYTSRDVVNIVSKVLKTKKVGHTGTLDPLAEGVLVLCIGEYTKLVSECTNHNKEYIATIKWGIETDTLDITGNILNKSELIPSEEELKDILSTFLGSQEQTVPLYSAKKVNGKKLYEYARAGIPVILPKQQIEIFELELLSYQEEECVIRCKVSKGTYIRSLIRDICYACKTVGVMSDLKRTKQGDFFIDDASALEEIQNGNYTMLTYQNLFDYDTYELSDMEYLRVKNGNEINLENYKNEVLLTYQGQDIALYSKKDTKYRPLLRLTSNS